MIEILNALAPIGVTTFLFTLTAFGFAPGFLLRLLVLLYPKTSARPEN